MRVVALIAGVGVGAVGAVGVGSQAHRQVSQPASASVGAGVLAASLSMSP
jgi:3-deoxy-D-arabino-heptulosonate 7-phosphate (DAHP) synthase